MGEERRIVTVLFADVVGSTALAQELDPEDLRVLLGRFYAIARDIIEARGGRLEKFIGDAVMAVFGLPHAHADDPDRALTAAWELSSRLRADPALAGQLPVRIGVSTGEVVATPDPRAGDFLVTGDPVHIAARLQQAAESWTVLCSERVVQAAGRRFAFGAPQEMTMKGVRAGVRARILLGPRTVPSRLRPQIPLFGRDADLAALESATRRAYAERRPCMVSLVGPAGIGKTRLMEALLDRLPRLEPDVLVAVAQCPPYGERLTYRPLRALLVSLAGLPDAEDAAAMRAGIDVWVRSLGVPHARRTAELLTASVGAAEGDILDRQDLFVAWRTTFEAAARCAPLLLVVEDIHWSSDSMLDLIEYLMEQSQGPIVSAVLARPELLARRPAWGTRVRGHLPLTLDRLSEEAIQELVAHTFAGRARDLAARIAHQVDGNPFYALEIAQAVLDRVPRLDDPAAIAGALTILPDTVHAAILARLDGLAPTERRVLALGGVFGGSFRLQDVAALDGGGSDLPGITVGLVDRGFLAFSGTDQVSFRHILIREVAYQTLTRSERARLHTLVADRLVALAGRDEAPADLVAHHYREAAALIPAPRTDAEGADRIRLQAGEWLCRAGEMDAGNAAFVEAQHHFEAALAFAGPERLPYIYERLGDVSPRDTGVVAYRTSLQLCRTQACGPASELRILASLLGLCMRWQGSVETRPSDEEIAGLRRDGRGLLPQVGHDRAAAAFLIADAFYPFWQQREVTGQLLQDAEQSAQQGLELARELGDLSLQSVALDALGGVALARGEWDRVHAAARQRLAFGERVNLGERLDARNMLAWSSAILGRLAEAERAALEGLSLLQPGQLPDFAINIATWRVYALTLLGNWAEALEAADRLYEAWAGLGRPPAGMVLRGLLPALDLARARRQEPLIERYGQAVRQVVSHFPVETTFGLLRGYAEADTRTLTAGIITAYSTARIRLEMVERAISLCSDAGDPPPRERVAPILEMAVSQGCRVLEAQARRALGVREGNPGELNRALDLFDEMGAVPYAARVRCERALVLGDTAELSAGLEALVRLGDLEQAGRIERRPT